MKDVDMEKGFLISIITEPSTADYLLKVDEHDFTDERKDIYKELYRQYNDKGKISKTKTLNFIRKKLNKDADYIKSNYSMPYELEHITEQLKRLSFKRNARNKFREWYELIQSDESVENIKSEIQDRAFNLTAESGDSKIIKNTDTVAMRSLERLEQRLNGNDVQKIKTGKRSLDGILGGGFRLNDLYILSGGTSMGKTAFASDILKGVMEKNAEPSLVFSLEMEDVSLFDRMLIQRSHVNADDFEQGMTKSQRSNIEAARSWLSEKPIYWIDKRGLDVKDIKSYSRLLNTKLDSELKFIVIDYLNIIKMKPIGGSFIETLGEIARELRALAKELNVSILLLHQMSRDFEKRNNHVPRKSDLRGSGELEQTADGILFVHRPEYFDAHKEERDEVLIQDNAMIVVAKQRKGKTGILTYTWYPEIQVWQDGLDYEDHGEIKIY